MAPNAMRLCCVACDIVGPSTWQANEGLAGSGYLKVLIGIIDRGCASSIPKQTEQAAKRSLSIIMSRLSNQLRKTASETRLCLGPHAPKIKKEQEGEKILLA